MTSLALQAGADPAPVGRMDEWPCASMLPDWNWGHWGNSIVALTADWYQRLTRHITRRSRAEAGNFSARFLNALVARGMAMTEDEGAALSEQIRDEILAKRAI